MSCHVQYFSKCAFYSFVGGLDLKHLYPVDYRTELREAKARIDLPFYRAFLDEFGFSLDFLLHAIESQLKETGTLPQIYSFFV